MNISIKIVPTFSLLASVTVPSAIEIYKENTRSIPPNEDVQFNSHFRDKMVLLLIICLSLSLRDLGKLLNVY